MKPELEFRDWLRKTYGVQDYEAYRNTQTEEIAIRYMEHCTEQLRKHDVSGLLIAWEQFRKANWYESEAVDVEAMLIEKFQAINCR